MPEIHPDAIASLINGDHGAPFDLLGAHPAGDGLLSVRAFRPWAKTLKIVVAGQADRPKEMTRRNDAGFFEVIVKGEPGLEYHFQETTQDGETRDIHDPYRFSATLAELDLYLMGEGRHWTVYDKLGAHHETIDGVSGVRFRLWAPNAYRVSVIADFNRWDARVHPMYHYADNGLWELFIPEAEVGSHYKFDLRCKNGYHTEKADPYARFSELRPRTASIVWDIDAYEWGDAAWMQTREADDPLRQPMNIYEVHLGSWRRKNGYEWLTYRDLADKLVAYVRDMGYTHIELMPVAEHPYDGSWGYQVTGYYSPTSRFGTPDDLMYFVDQCHQNGIGVLVDWVPAHFPKDGFALSYFDGTFLYEHADPRQREHPDWGTYIFNYGRNEVRNFLIANALFWLKKYHIDGLRVDAVSSMLYLDFGRSNGEWVANQYGSNENIEAIHFLQEANHIIHQEAPGGITIAEESTSWGLVSRPTYLGGLGFTFKWDMGWMHDTLSYIQVDPVYRRYHHNQITFSMMYAYSENFVLSLSHDEVVHGKGSLIGKVPGDDWQRFATLRLLFGYQATHTGKMLNFMGAEFGQRREWTEAHSLDWHLLDYAPHEQLQSWVKDLNAFYKAQPALWELDYDASGFGWIEPNDADNSTFSYIRYAADARDFIIVVCNFTPVPRHDYRIGVPEHGFYEEVLNSDAATYGGGNVGNYGGRWSDEWGTHGYPHSLSLTVPPLGMALFKVRRD